MMRKIKTITVSLLLISLMMIFAGCHHSDPPVGDITVNRGNFLKEANVDDITFKEVDTKDGTPLGYMPVDEDIAEGSDQVAAALHLIQVAEHNYYRADYLARLSSGGGSATAKKDKISLEGKMAVRSFMLREPDKSYSQTIGRVYEGAPSEMLLAAQFLLDQGKRGYTVNLGKENEVSYRQEPKNSGKPRMDDNNFPYATIEWKGKVKTVNAGDVDEDDFSLKYKGELTNFKITADTIKNCSVTFKDDIYTVNYEMDITNDEAVDKPRASLRKSASSNDLQYKKYKVSMEVWENGLIRSFSTEEAWEATLVFNVIGTIEVNGSSDSKNTDSYSWDQNDCLIDSYVKEGIISIDWMN